MNLNWRRDDEVVCPFCDYKYDASNEFLEGNTSSGTLTCDKCEKDFTWEADFTIDFTTRRIEEKSE